MDGTELRPHLGLGLEQQAEDMKGKASGPASKSVKSVKSRVEARLSGPDKSLTRDELCLHPGPDSADPGSLSILGLEPSFMRLAPPMLEVTDSEMIWINPDYAPQLLWESSLCQDNSKGAEIRELMSKVRGPFKSHEPHERERDSDSAALTSLWIAPRGVQACHGLPTTHSPFLALFCGYFACRPSKTRSCSSSSSRC